MNPYTKYEYLHFLEDIATIPDYYHKLSREQKNEWAIKGATYLICTLDDSYGEKRPLWGFWKRVKKAEKNAINMTRLMDHQAISIKNYGLYMHWVHVRISLKERSYC